MGLVVGCWGCGTWFEVGLLATVKEEESFYFIRDVNSKHVARKQRPEADTDIHIPMSACLSQCHSAQLDILKANTITKQCML